MLFDLRGKRRRLIQVIYAFLALLLGGGLVIFGIGGDAPGGLGEVFGIDTQSHRASQDNPQFERDISRYEERLEVDPEDREALIELSRLYFLAGQTNVEVDHEGFRTVNEGAADDFRQSIATWERYLATEPRNPDENAATLTFQAYSMLLEIDQRPDRIESLLEGGVQAAQVIADARPSEGAFIQLATFAYLADQPKVAERAERKALAEADGPAAEQIEEQLKFYKRQGRQLASQLAEAPPGAEDLENPLSGFGAPQGGIGP